jgi:hypothetical protein
MSEKKIVSSPSRTYVAICNKANFDGYYMRKFTLPLGYIGEGCYEEEDGSWNEGAGSWVCQNTTSYASWYFLNKLNHVACVNECMTIEDYLSLRDQDEINETFRVINEAFIDGSDSATRRLTARAEKAEAEVLALKKVADSITKKALVT